MCFAPLFLRFCWVKKHGVKMVQTRCKNDEKLGKNNQIMSTLNCLNISWLGKNCGFLFLCYFWTRYILCISLYITLYTYVDKYLQNTLIIFYSNLIGVSEETLKTHFKEKHKTNTIKPFLLFLMYVVLLCYTAVPFMYRATWRHKMHHITIFNLIAP